MVAGVFTRLKSLRQVAALPFIVRDSGIDVLLITSRRRGRWVIPKGWPMKGCTLAESARREALEEAGVRGTIGEAPLGSYRYGKRMKLGYEVGATVFVYPLLVGEHRLDWPERRQRRLAWHRLEAAARIVDDRGLGRLLGRLARNRGRTLRALAAELSPEAEER